MTVAHRVLQPHPVTTLEDYTAIGGGEALRGARAVPPGVVVDELKASGLRGRGGAGFPTGVKWETLRANRSERFPSTVVVNAAEGEPGTFKDRALWRNNPYAVIEGALIAAHVIGADRVVVATKESFAYELGRITKAVEEIEAAEWPEGIAVKIFPGPAEYLYGEETALLECLDGRHPFPRVTPPYRRGVDEIPADAVIADEAPPTLVDNVETLAHVPGIVLRGAAWFRSVGTEQSPGTLVVTVTGSTLESGVGEFEMGTPLREAIETLGGGPRGGKEIVAVLPGVSAGMLTADQLDTPLTYEDLEASGSGLGSAGFVVVDSGDDVVAVAAGASRFLAVESCGQCTPCKQDGLAIAGLLENIARSECDAHDVDELRGRLATVGDEARCFLASQQQAVVTSLLERFGAAIDAHVAGTAPAAEPALIAELVEIEGDQPVWDERHRDKQPDWSYDETWSGSVPAELHGTD